MESQQTRVLVQLRDLILKGAFAPGERLAEIPIAEKLHASRTPVRVALSTLEQEGLVEVSAAGGYAMRRFTQREIQDAIDVRGQLEGMAARLIAEHGVPRQLSLDLRECLKDGDRILKARTLGYDGYAAYAAMNDRFHRLIVDGCGNAALARSIELNNRLPFAPASAMLPMQSSMDEGHQWMLYAHRQHHSLVDAMERGQGARAQSLGQEHVHVAKLNLEFALEAPEAAAKVMPAIKLVSGTP
jgi:GntR family transcriptional regulator, vanillate catabolism transcriptional regulator